MVLYQALGLALWLLAMLMGQTCKSPEEQNFRAGKETPQGL